jgi:hypothetical protein
VKQVDVGIDTQNGQVTIRFPNRGRGGWRAVVEHLSLLDLLQLQAAIDEALVTINDHG